jgi:hypothetical protein
MNPGAHQELDGEVGLAGGRPAARNLVAALSGTCGETVVSGGDSGHPGPIRLAGRKRAGWRSSGAHRWSRGRGRTAASSSGHGGHAQIQRENTGKRKPGRERGRGSSGGVQQCPGSLLGRQHSKQEVAGVLQGQDTQVLPCPNKEDKADFADTRLDLGSFLDNFKIALVCII